MESIRIKNIRILTLENGEYLLKPCSMLIDIKKSIILDIEYYSEWEAAIDFNNDILIPRLFNIHCHLGENHFKSIAGNDWTISRYLDYTNDYNDQLSKEELSLIWEDSARITLQECIKYGTGGICAGRAANAIEGTNINCMSGYPLMNTKKLNDYTRQGINGFLIYKERYEQDRCNVGVLMHSLYTNNSESMAIATECMEKGAGFFAIHLSEDSHTRDMEIAKCGMEPIKYLDLKGLLTDKTIIVHGGCLNDEELQILSQRNSIIAICPISNGFLNTPSANIDKLNKYGVKWCVATDGPATGRTMSLLKQSQKIVAEYPQISKSDILKAMTIIPARLYDKKIYQGLFNVGTEAIGLKIKSKVDNCTELIDQIVNNKIKYELFDPEEYCKAKKG